ncbi:flagellar motor switch protein FliN [bacterium]|jgi:flagellar motor switch protein FliN|nr:flagellar motor switch protein FliN [bacterium]
MTNNSGIKDPLEDIDPIMEQAFSMDPQVSSREEDPTRSVAAPNVSNIQFPKLASIEGSSVLEQDIFSSIPVSVSVELGRSNLSLKEVYELSEGSIIELERLVGEPLDLVVNGQTIAQGEVVAIDNNYGLRVTNILSSEK